MSFSNEQKAFVIAQVYKGACCRRSLLNGALFAKGALSSDKCVELSLSDAGVLEFLSRLVAEFYGSFPEIRTSSVGGKRKLVCFKSKSVSKYLMDCAEHVPFEQKCENCISSFLRGVFLASGRISDPKKQYLLEFSLGDRCRSFIDFLGGIGINSKQSDKPNEKVVYLKNSSDIEDFFGYAGLNKALFTFIDAKAEGEIRKHAMRVANCETKNIDRSTAAAQKQLAVITALDNAGLLSLLPEELESTARLRLEYFDLSLSQLAQVSVPPISKPGLSHRLKKIIELGEAILEKHDNHKRSK